MDTTGHTERYEQLSSALMESISFVDTNELFGWVKSLLSRIKVLEEKLDGFSRYDEILEEKNIKIIELQKLIHERDSSIEQRDKEIKAIRDQNNELQEVIANSIVIKEKMDKILKDRTLEVEELTKKNKEMKESLETNKFESENHVKNLLDRLETNGNKMEAKYLELTRNSEQQQARLRRAVLVLCSIFVTMGKILKKISTSQGGAKIPQLEEIRRQWETVRESSQLDRIIPSLALWKDYAHLIPEELKSRCAIASVTTATGNVQAGSQARVTSDQIAS